MNRVKFVFVVTAICLGLIELTSSQQDFSSEENESREKFSAEDNFNENRESQLSQLLSDRLRNAITKNESHNDDDSEEEEEERESETEYNPYRDNFYDQYEDGAYVYGYSLPYGVRRYERSYYSEKYKSLVVEGFYTEARHFGQRVRYELRCYRSDAYGYRPLKVQYLRRPPIVRRGVEPNVDCFNN